MKLFLHAVLEWNKEELEGTNVKYNQSNMYDLCAYYIITYTTSLSVENDSKKNAVCFVHKIHYIKHSPCGIDGRSLNHLILY